MEIQWSLVLFSALAGTGGWVLTAIAIDEFMGENIGSHFNAGIAAIALMIVGGICSTTHLSHPERMMGALAHPTSDIFYEAALIGITIILATVFLILTKRRASIGLRKLFAGLAAAVGIVLSFVTGLGYAVMSARYSWNTPLLPLGYLATSVSTGFAAYMLVVLQHDRRSSIKTSAIGVLAGGIAAVAASIFYAMASGTVASHAVVLWGLVVITGGIVPAVLGAFMLKRPESAFGVAAGAAACGLAGSVAFRCFMWMSTVAVADLFLQL